VAVNVAGSPASTVVGNVKVSMIGPNSGGASGRTSRICSATRVTTPAVMVTDAGWLRPTSVSPANALATTLWLPVDRISVPS
jgi:hypothetical protein